MLEFGMAAECIRFAKKDSKHQVWRNVGLNKWKQSIVARKNTQTSAYTAYLVARHV